MISEAWARRRHKAVFINKVDEALGEANETRSWLDDALDCGYLAAEQFNKMERDWLSTFIDAGSHDRSVPPIFVSMRRTIDYRVIRESADN